MTFSRQDLWVFLGYYSINHKGNNDYASAVWQPRVGKSELLILDELSSIHPSLVSNQPK